MQETQQLHYHRFIVKTRPLRIRFESLNNSYKVFQYGARNAGPSRSISTLCVPSNLNVELAEKCRNWDDLLPEVLEIVLQKLARDQGIQSILTCRLINSHWKSVAETILERDCLSEYKNVLLTFSLPIPRLWIPISEDNETVEKIWCPDFLANWDRNPFPSKSLIVSHWQPNRLQQEHNNCPVSVFKLMVNHGHNLSSFTLDAANFTSPQFLRLVLGEMKNLKALLLSRIHLKTDDKEFGKELTFAPSPHLRTLKLFFNCIESSTKEHSFGEFNQWLATCFGGTLTYLEMDDAKELSITPDIFPNLRVLKILDVGTTTLCKSGGLSRLERLSITDLSDKPNGKNPTYFKDLFNFLESCATTLFHLKLDIGIDNIQTKENEFQLRTHIMYPYLKRFSIIFPDEDEVRELNALKCYFLPRFSALEILDLMSFAQTSLYEEDDEEQNIKVITEFLQREIFWSNSPKLRSVRVLDSAWLDEEPILICYRPPEYCK